MNNHFSAKVEHVKVDRMRARRSAYKAPFEVRDADKGLAPYRNFVFISNKYSKPDINYLCIVLEAETRARPFKYKSVLFGHL